MIIASAVQNIHRRGISIECCHEWIVFSSRKLTINQPKARNYIWCYRSADMCLAIRKFAAQNPARFLLPSGMSHLGTCVTKHLLPTRRRIEHARNHAVSKLPRPPPRKGT